jgi:hypothetical protein
VHAVQQAAQQAAHQAASASLSGKDEPLPSLQVGGRQQPGSGIGAIDSPMNFHAVTDTQAQPQDLSRLAGGSNANTPHSGAGGFFADFSHVVQQAATSELAPHVVSIPGQMQMAPAAAAASNGRSSSASGSIAEGPPGSFIPQELQAPALPVLAPQGTLSEMLAPSGRQGASVRVRLRCDLSFPSKMKVPF